MGKKKQQKKLVKSILREIVKIKEGRPGEIGATGAPGISEEKFRNYLQKQLDLTDRKFADRISEQSERLLNELAHRDQISQLMQLGTLHSQVLRSMAGILTGMGSTLDALTTAVNANTEKAQAQDDALTDLRVKLEALKVEVREIPLIYNLKFTTSGDYAEPTITEDFTIVDETKVGTEQYEAKRAEPELTPDEAAGLGAALLAAAQVAERNTP